MMQDTTKGKATDLRFTIGGAIVIVQMTCFHCHYRCGHEWYVKGRKLEDKEF